MKNTSSFRKLVEAALKKFTDAPWLGKNSPLATPYFLGSHMRSDVTGARARGQSLQGLLRLAATKMVDERDNRSRRLLEIYYFANSSVDAAYQSLDISKAQFHNDRRRAIDELTTQLIKEIQPALRLESPSTVQTELLERRVVIERLDHLLGQKQSIFITGTGGIGKTSLGSFMAHQFYPKNTFWYTIRVGLNDHLNSFIFSFAYFCYQHGATTLWQEVVAAEAQVPQERLLELLRYTLDQLPRPPLICIDEADLLVRTKNGDHAALVQVVRGLRGLVPMLLMGQQAAFEADHFEELEPLSIDAVEYLLTEQSISLMPSEIDTLQKHLHGNPQLIQLLCVLLQEGESLHTLLTEMQQSSSVQFLLGRILLRLNEMECSVLMDLAVYETTAPAEVWSVPIKVQYALHSLHQKQLVRFDEQGGVFVPPTYRTIFMDAIPTDKLTQLHQKAAEVFLQRGQTTQASRHYAKTAEPEVAIWIWREDMQQEINQGQAHAALSLFEEMRSEALSVEAREQATLYCASLKHLLGRSTTAQDDIHSILWRTPVLQVEAQLLDGMIYNDKSHFFKAEQVFSKAISTAEILLETRLAHLHKGLGWGFMQERQLEKAWTEALMARYEAENLQGTIELTRNCYVEAEEFYLSALELAIQANYQQGIAKTSGHLAWLYAIQGAVEDALSHAEKAIESYAQMGKLVPMISENIVIALAYNLSSRHQNAIDALNHCVNQFSEMGIPIPPRQDALIHQAFAEAYLGMDALEKAGEHVSQAIATEEIAVLPDSYRTFGEILLKNGDAHGAARWIQSSLELLSNYEQPDFYLAGYAWRALAEVYLVQGDQLSAYQAKGTSIELFEKINLTNEIERTETILFELTTI